MPYLTNLADVARSAGLTVVEQAGWKTRGHGAQTDVKAIVCHHTGGSPNGDAPSLGTVQNGRADLAGPLSHFVLSRSGIVYVVAAGQCWHTGSTLQTWQSNAHAIGIEAEGTGTAPWPETQMVAYGKLCAALAKAFTVPVSRVLGHKEVCAPVGRKIDPNFDMNSFRLRVASYMSGDPVPGPDPTTRKGTAEMVERVHVVPPNASTNSVRVNLSGTETAGIVVRPKMNGDGTNNPMWLVEILAWGNDKAGIGHNPAAAPGYNARMQNGPRRFELPGAVWADVRYSAAPADEFDIDCY